MSSVILYLGIVAIWAFVLIPRWLRRPHLLGGESAEHEPHGHDADGDELSEDEAWSGDEPDQAEAGLMQSAPPRLSRARVLQARRRLLTMLVTLMVVAGGCTYLKLTSWWACVPPAVMLGMYLLLLRETALADAEHARWWATEDRRVRVARQFAPVEYSAEVIDISDRLGDQLYDQYADATIRAVGD